MIPWVLSDSNFARNVTQKLDSSKTVFVGGLHGMINAGMCCRQYSTANVNELFVFFIRNRSLSPSLNFLKISQILMLKFLMLKFPKFKSFQSFLTFTEVNWRKWAAFSLYTRI